MLNNTSILLCEEFYYSVEPLIWVFLVEIGSNKKLCFVIKGVTYTLLIKFYLLSIKVCLIGTSTVLRYCSKYTIVLFRYLFKLKHMSLKEAGAVFIYQIEQRRVKPYLSLRHLFSKSRVNLNLRKESRPVGAFSLVSRFAMSIRARRMSIINNREFDFKKSIMVSLANGI